MQEYPDNINIPVITVTQNTQAYGYTEDGKNSSGAVIMFVFQDSSRTDGRINRGYV